MFKLLRIVSLFSLLGAWIGSAQAPLVSGTHLADFHPKCAIRPFLCRH